MWREKVLRHAGLPTGELPGFSSSRPFEGGGLPARKLTDPAPSRHDRKGCQTDRNQKGNADDGHGFKGTQRSPAMSFF
jgi:hypothetical protein